MSCRACSTNEELKWGPDWNHKACLDRRKQEDEAAEAAAKNATAASAKAAPPAQVQRLQAQMQQVVGSSSTAAPASAPALTSVQLLQEVQADLLSLKATMAELSKKVKVLEVGLNQGPSKHKLQSSCFIHYAMTPYYIKYYLKGIVCILNK